jgi:hypothetical protein
MVNVSHLVKAIVSGERRLQIGRRARDVVVIGGFQGGMKSSIGQKGESFVIIGIGIGL